MPIIWRALTISGAQKMRGESLLEVVLALWLLGTAAWAAVHFHLKTTHFSHSLQWRAQAIHILEATAQAVESGQPIYSVQALANKHAAALLPAGGVSIKVLPNATLQVVDFARGPFLIKVSWNTRSSRLASSASQYTMTSKMAKTHGLIGEPESVYVAVMQ